MPMPSIGMLSRHRRTVSPARATWGIWRMRAEQAGGSRPSVGRLAAPLVEALADEAQALRLAVRRTVAGARLIDAGIDAAGGIEAGRGIPRDWMGGGRWGPLAGSGARGWAVP